MELNTEDLKQVEDYASYFFTPEEIGIIMNLRQQWVRFAMMKKTPFQDAFMRGQLISEAAVRKSIFDLAKSGSAPAQVLAVQIMNLSRLKNV